MASYDWSDEELTPELANTYLRREQGPWASWTPTVTQSGSVSVRVIRARYFRMGRFRLANAHLYVTGTGTASNNIVISTPDTASTSSDRCIGTGVIKDFSASLTHRGIPFLASTTSFILDPTASTTATGALGSLGFTAALTEGDKIMVAIGYEAAAG